MHQYLVKITLLVAFIIVILFLGLYFPERGIMLDMHNTIHQKHDHILSHIDEQKIILIGGSNVAFGFDSQYLEEQLEIPVINTAIHGAYGLKYILDEIEPYIDQKSIVMIAPEYDQFFGTLFWGDHVITAAIKESPFNIKLLNWNQFKVFTKYLPRYCIKRTIKSLVYYIKNPRPHMIPYLKNGFNEYGDIVAHKGLESRIDDVDKELANLNTTAVDYLANYISNLESKGAVVYLSYPSLLVDNYMINEDHIALLDQQFKDKNLTLLGTPDQFLFTENEMYDTRYHLNQDGINRRTKMSLVLLKDVLEF